MGGYLFIFSLLSSLLCDATETTTSTPLVAKNIRVAIEKGRSETKVCIAQAKIFDFDKKQTLFETTKEKCFTISSDKENSININNNKIASKHIIIHSKLKEFIVDNNKYNGFLEISIPEKNLLLINHIPLNQYLASLLGKEMNPKWPINALKAQAVAARTYALASMIESIDKLYDVETDIRDQVYAGCIAEAQKTKEAVKETKGEILTHNGLILKTYYHSNSGGHTENPSRIWGGNEKYMPGIADPYVFNQPGYFWTYTVSTQELQEKLLGLGFVFNYLFGVSISNHTNSGRVSHVNFQTESKIFSLPATKFRELLGFSSLKSTMFLIAAQDGNSITFEGKGHGHGAGMSQWGAKKMSEKGLAYTDILKFYYPNLNLEKLW